MAKKKITAPESLTFSGMASSPESKADRNLQDELYKKSWMASTIDNFEKLSGIAPKVKKPKLKYKTKMFKPEFEKDQALLDVLFNDPRFSIVSMDKNWGQDGKLSIFAIYSENLEYKSPLTAKDISEGKS